MWPNRVRVETEGSDRSPLSERDCRRIEVRMGEIRDGFGAAGGAKYGYQSARAFQGLGTTTRATAAFDLISGGVGSQAAADLGETAKSLSTTTKGGVGAAKISRFARVAGYAGKAAPVVARGSAVLGVALGGYEIGQGVDSLSDGKTEKGRDQIISGSADVITSGALGVAAVSSGTVVGLPVAAVALGVAGVSQGAKYAWKYRENLGDAAEWTGNKISGAADWAGDKIADAAQGIGSSVKSGFNSLRDALF